MTSKQKQPSSPERTAFLNLFDAAGVDRKHVPVRVLPIDKVPSATEADEMLQTVMGDETSMFAMHAVPKHVGKPATVKLFGIEDAPDAYSADPKLGEVGAVAHYEKFDMVWYVKQDTPDSATMPGTR